MAALQRESVWKAQVSDLVLLEGFNSRDDYGDIEELARSIEEHGVRDPLRGYRNGEQCIVTDGHRRTKAIHLLLSRGVEILRVPFIIEDRKATESDYLLTQLLSNSGKPFSPLEESKVIAKLQTYGWAPAEIATKTGFELSKVERLLLLDSAPETMKVQIRSGKLSQSAVLEAVRGTETNAEATEVLAAAQELAISEGASIKVEHVRNAKRAAKDERTPTEKEASRQAIIKDLAGTPWEVLSIDALEKVKASLVKVQHKINKTVAT